MDIHGRSQNLRKKDSDRRGGRNKQGGGKGAVNR